MLRYSSIKKKARTVRNGEGGKRARLLGDSKSGLRLGRDKDEDKSAKIVDGMRKKGVKDSNPFLFCRCCFVVLLFCCVFLVLDASLFFSH